MTNSKPKKPAARPHTPGPWRVEGDALRGWEHRVTAATFDNRDMRLTVADIPNAYNLAKLDPEVEANARLIAAAPDLLEACRVLTNTDAGDAMTRLARGLELARAAIAKAEGRDE